MRRLGYSPKELAKMLGLHHNTIYRLIWDGQLRAVRIAGRLIIPKEEVERLGFSVNEEKEPRGWGS